ncbi:hypothetical protein VRRI112168_00115 [Vreelandella rituensis]|uniref:Uncharacterized protein n=1 Tax=Vreelandella rituensis TaxID=2282306 RepID=A0A368UBA9_9GAMM|nr:hypothetical protein [Halomonas rituensis]RCV93897.1 hypothetical protein DU506_01690 [Halomonas rituensis]
MAKIVIPPSSSQNISVQGVGNLHPVDQQIVSEILTRMEPRLRQAPRIANLTEIAMSFIRDEAFEHDASMLLTLAQETGETSGPIAYPAIQASRVSMDTYHTSQHRLH